jgi:hypothetical protein
MQEDMNDFNFQQLTIAVDAELAYIRRLGANENLAFAASNLSAYEALLFIMRHADRGVPIYHAISNVSSPFSGPAGVLGRLKTMRSLGLLEEREGVKKSQVCLAPSEKLMSDLGPILFARHKGTADET